MAKLLPLSEICLFPVQEEKFEHEEDRGSGDGKIIVGQKTRNDAKA